MEWGRNLLRSLTYGTGERLSKALGVIMCLGTPLMADEVTVLAFGDSLTQGYGLPAADGLVPQMQLWLDTQGADVQLINAGVSGDTTAGGAARIDWSLTDGVDAMILTLGGNDLLRGLDPSESKANLDAIIQAAQARDVEVLLVGLLAFRNMGNAYKNAFDGMYPTLAKERGVQFYPYFFSGLGSGTPAELQPYFQRDGVHPSAEGVAKIVEALGPAVQELIASVE